jgi:simple sugar transport system permease protein
MIVGALISLIFGLAVVIFKAEIVVGGLALVFLGYGLTGLVGKDYVQDPAAATIPHWDIPGLSDIPFWGEAFFQQLSISYFALLLPVAVMFLLYRTQHGLNMRSIGEDPGAADTTGLSVNGWRLFYVGVAGAFAGLGGAVLTLGIVGSWLPNVTAGEGWIALAVVIFASWRPLPLIAGALLFGGLGTFGNVAQAQGWSVAPEFFGALPYVGTLALVYLLAALRIQRGGGQPWPASLGLPFFRGTD